MKRKIVTLEEGFWERVNKKSPEECWLWKGMIVSSNRGYGCYRDMYAHRISFALQNGEIPSGLVIDHICRNRLCVNPNHLRAVTPKINALENSVSPVAANAKKTHCKRGHPFIGNNILRMKGRKSKNCRTCHNIEQRGRYQRNRQKLLQQLLDASQ